MNTKIKITCLRVYNDIVTTICIHGRHIYESTALSRDIIDYDKVDGIPMSISI